MKTFLSISCSSVAVVSSLIGCGAPPADAIGQGSSDLTIASGVDLSTVPVLQLGLGYSVSSLPFSPVGISDYGAIVGSANGAAVASINGGTVTPLPLPSGLGPTYRADAISSAGVTVGDAAGVGIVWQVNPACPLPGHCVPPVTIVAPGFAPVKPLAVSNSSVVVGTFERTPGFPRAFRWTPQGGFEDITPPDYSTAAAYDVNENGFIAGEATRPGHDREAMRWSPSTPSVATALDSGVGRAQGIRDNGDAVGTIDVFLAVIPRLWTLTGKAFELGGPHESEIDGFAETGRLVGHTLSRGQNLLQQPWTFYRGTTTMLPWTPSTNADHVASLAANACGTIVGTQSFVGGERGLMWTQADCDPPGSTLPILPVLTVSVSGSGKVTSHPSGISCGSTGSACSAQFEQAAVVTLNAQATGGTSKGTVSVFDHWDGACAGQGSSCALTMTAAKSTRAVFVRETL